VANQNLDLLDIYILSKGARRHGDKELLLGEIIEKNTTLCIVTRFYLSICLLVCIYMLVCICLLVCL